MTPSFYVENRRLLGEKLKGGVAVLSAHSEMQRGLDSAFGFEQEANFWYLTGINRPDWWVIIDGSRHKTWLVLPDTNEVARIFDGELSPDEATSISGADTVITREEAEILLRDLARQHSVVYSLGNPPGMKYLSFTPNPARRLMWQRLERTFVSVQDLRLELSAMRAIKQPEELRAIRKAIKLTCEGFDHIKSNLADFKYEYQIEAEFTHYFRSRGARGHAYDPIVAAGKNACTLHYSDNDARLRSGQLVLIDIGARVLGYAADITRTFAYGQPTKFAATVHGRVRKAHEDIIKLLEPGLKVSDYHDQVDEIMKQALVDLKLIDSPSDLQGYRRYFPHAISHGLGIDVHDSLGKPAVFEPGMVLTVEPGIYISEKNVGVRIEDDILITASGHENLSRPLSTDL